MRYEFGLLRWYADETPATFNDNKIPIERFKRDLQSYLDRYSYVGWRICSVVSIEDAFDKRIINFMVFMQREIE